MHHPTDRMTHTTAFVTPVVEHWLEREISQWVHCMKDRSDDPSHHEQTLLPRSYISLHIVVHLRYPMYLIRKCNHFPHATCDTNHMFTMINKSTRGTAVFMCVSGVSAQTICCWSEIDPPSVN